MRNEPDERRPGENPEVTTGGCSGHRTFDRHQFLIAGRPEKDRNDVGRRKPQKRKGAESDGLVHAERKNYERGGTEKAACEDGGHAADLGDQSVADEAPHGLKCGKRRKAETRVSSVRFGYFPQVHGRPV